MRKYHQLLLFVVAVISLSLLLVYRHEYNRLHYVLEVFNFFGQSCNLTQLGQIESLNQQHWGPEPVWHSSEGSPGFHVYSAFWTEENQVKAIVVQDTRKEAPRSCYLWFEDYRKPVVGKFRFGQITQKSPAYFYYCASVSSTSVPYAVSFASKSAKIPVRSITKPSHFSNTTICVVPAPEFSKAALLEFLSFHHLIGVNDFIFYDGTIPYRLVKIITNLSLRLGIRVSFFPWNYPKRGEVALTRSLVESDCLIRTMGYANNSIILDINEYVVPRQHYSFTDAVNSVASDRLRLPVQYFCVTSKKRNRPIIIQNLDTYIASPEQDLMRFVYKSLAGTGVIASDVASVHKYIDCGNRTNNLFRDETVLNYDRDLTRSTLMQLLLHDHI